jgi:hypothetical protein
MSTRSRKIMFVCSRERTVRKADNLTAICEPTVHILWGPQHLTALYASTACYGVSFNRISGCGLDLRLPFRNILHMNCYRPVSAPCSLDHASVQHENLGLLGVLLCCRKQAPVTAPVRESSTPPSN